MECQGVCVEENTSGEYSAPSQRKRERGMEEGWSQRWEMKGEKKKKEKRDRKERKREKKKGIKWFLPHYFFTAAKVAGTFLETAEFVPWKPTRCLDQA